MNFTNELAQLPLFDPLLQLSTLSGESAVTRHIVVENTDGTFCTVLL